jgi:hypothetical protein
MDKIEMSLTLRFSALLKEISLIDWAQTSDVVVAPERHYDIGNSSDRVSGRVELGSEKHQAVSGDRLNRGADSYALSATLTPLLVGTEGGVAEDK